MLTLTGCSDIEFTCNDGSCVSMEVRCDDKTDCEDQSDEDDCLLIKPNSQYKKALVPHPGGDWSYLRVNITVHVQE